MRQHEDETVLVVANLSRFAQYVELDLSKYKGATPVELFGKTKFPVVGDGPYLVTLGPHGFYWFSLDRPTVEQERLSMPPSPLAVVCTSLDALLLGDERPLLGDVLPPYLEARPWYEGRHRTLRSAQIADAVRVETPKGAIYFVFVQVDYADAAQETYMAPLAWVAGDSLAARAGVVALVHVAGGERGALVDATEEPWAASALLELIAGQKTAAAGESGIVASTLRLLPRSEVDTDAEPRKLGRERGHTSIRYGERFVLKLARRLEEGVSPEIEVGRFLANRTSGIAPRLCGMLELHRPGALPATLATLHTFVPSSGTGWAITLKELGELLRAGPRACAW